MTCNSPIGSSSACPTTQGNQVGQAFTRLSELLQDRRLLDLLDDSRSNGSIVDGGCNQGGGGQWGGRCGGTNGGQGTGGAAGNQLLQQLIQLLQQLLGGGQGGGSAGGIGGVGGGTGGAGGAGGCTGGTGDAGAGGQTGGAGGMSGGSSAGGSSGTSGTNGSSGSSGSKKSSSAGGGGEDAEIDSLIAALENGGIGNIWAILHKIIQAIDKQIVGKVKEMAQMKKDLGQVEGEGQNGDAAKKGDIEGKMEELGFEIQRLKQVRQQISGMLTNILKTDGDTKMAIINNLRS